MWLVQGALAAGLVVLVLAGSLVLALLVLQARSLWRVRKIPGPRAWPLLGNKREIDRLDPGCPERALGQLVPRYGDVFRVNLANFCLAAVLSPADALQVTRTLDLPKPRFVYETLPFHGLVGITNVKEHRFRRALLAPTFKCATVSIAVVTRAMLGKVVQRLRAAAAAAQRQAAASPDARAPPIDIKELMVAMTMDVMAHWAFHIDLHMIDRAGSQANPLAAAMVEVFDFTQRVVRTPAVALNPIAQLRRMRAQRVITSTVMSIVQHRRTTDPHSPPDVIDRLLHEQKTHQLAGEFSARGETPFEIRDRHIVDEVITILQAGSETTSSTLGMMFRELARHPEWQDRAVAEIGGVLAGRSSAALEDFDLLHRLPVCMAIMNETLRLYSPAPGVARQAQVDVHLSGRVIPAGTYIDVCMAGMGQRPDLWGSDVREFNPDRFLSRYTPDNVKAKFIPFSAGTRACIGERIARIEVLLTLVELLPRFRFVIAPEDDGLVEQTLSMHAKNDVLVHISTRAGAPASPS